MLKRKSPSAQDMYSDILPHNSSTTSTLHVASLAIQQAALIPPLLFNIEWEIGRDGREGRGEDDVLHVLLPDD